MGKTNEAHGAFFTVYLDRVNGRQVLDFAQHIKGIEYSGNGLKRHQLVTPDTGSVSGDYFVPLSSVPTKSRQC